METKILEGNKLIAEFMGIKEDDGFYHGLELKKAGIPFSMGAMGNGVFDLQFNRSWSWLMPVVAKITQNESFIGNIYRENLVDIVPYAILEDVFDSVVDFIKHRNERN